MSSGDDDKQSQKAATRNRRGSVKGSKRQVETETSQKAKVPQKPADKKKPQSKQASEKLESSELPAVPAQPSQKGGAVK